MRLNDMLCCKEFDVADRVQEIRLPTELVCGSEDTMTPVRFTEDLDGNIRGARKSMVDGASHYVQIERYQNVNEDIEKFLSWLA